MCDFPAHIPSAYANLFKIWTKSTFNDGMTTINVYRQVFP